MNDDIWAKLIYFERNKRLAKAYVSAPVLTIDGSTQGLDGFRIGLSGIENSARTLDSMACLRSIGRGIRLRIDSQGNIIMRRNANNNGDAMIAQQQQQSDSNGSNAIGSVKLRSWLLHNKATNRSHAQAHQATQRVDAADCLVSELSAGQAIKLFDMQKFRSVLRQNSTGDTQSKSQQSQFPDWRQCVNLISFVKPKLDGGATAMVNAKAKLLDPLADPCWLMIINIIAIDMLKSAQQQHLAQVLGDPRASILGSERPEDPLGVPTADEEHEEIYSLKSNVDSGQRRVSRAGSQARTVVGQHQFDSGSSTSSSNNPSSKHALIQRHQQTQRRSRIPYTQDGVVAPPGGAQQRALSSMGRAEQSQLRLASRQLQQLQKERRQRAPRVAMLPKSASQQHLNRQPSRLVNPGRGPNQTIYTTFNYNRFNRGGAIHAQGDNGDYEQQMINNSGPIRNPLIKSRGGRQVDLAAVRMGKLSLSSFELSQGVSLDRHNRGLFNSNAILMNYDDEERERDGDFVGLGGEISKIGETIGKKGQDDSAIEDQEDSLQTQDNRDQQARKQKISRASLDSSGASSHSSHSTASSSGCVDAAGCQDEHGFPFLATENHASSSCFSLTSSSHSARPTSPPGHTKSEQKAPSSIEPKSGRNNMNNLNKSATPATTATATGDKPTTTKQTQRIISGNSSKKRIQESSDVGNCSSSSGLSSSCYSALTNDSTRSNSRTVNATANNSGNLPSLFRDDQQLGLDTIPRALWLSKKVTCITRPAKALLERGLSSSESSLTAMLQDGNNEIINYAIGPHCPCCMIDNGGGSGNDRHREHAHSDTANHVINLGALATRSRSPLLRSPRSLSAGKNRADHLQELDCATCTLCNDLASSPRTPRNFAALSRSISNSNSGSSPSSAASSSSAHSPPSIPMRDADLRDLRKFKFSKKASNEPKNVLARRRHHESRGKSAHQSCCPNPMTSDDPSTTSAAAATDTYDTNMASQQYSPSSSSSDGNSQFNAKSNSKGPDLQGFIHIRAASSQGKLARKKRYGNLFSRFIQPFGSSTQQLK